MASDDGRLIRWLLDLYPADFRRAHEGQLVQSMRDVLRDAGDRSIPRARTIAWLVGDTLVTVARIRWTRRRDRTDMNDREGGMGRGWVREIRHAARALRRSPGFTITAVLTMGLGVGANTAIFSLVHTVLLEPLPYEGASSLVQVQNRYLPGGSTGWVSVPEYWEYRKTRDSFSAWAALSPDAANLTGLTTPLRVEGLWVTPEYFEMLGAAPALGRTFTHDELDPGAEPVVVLGHALWQDAFGSDRDVLGKSIDLDGTLRTVVGVMGPEYEPLSEYVFPGRTEDYWVPLTIDPGSFDGRTVERHNLFVLGRLAAGSDPRTAERIMEVAVHRVESLYPGLSNEGSRDVAVVPVREIVAGPVRGTLQLLTIAVALLLLVAAVNVANLTLARADARSSEFAARAALGASRSQLLWSATAESLLVGLAAGALGLLFVASGSGLLIRLVPSTIPLPDGVTIGLPVVLFTLGISALGGLLSGALAARRLISGDVFAAIRSGGRMVAAGPSNFRHALVVGQVAGAVVLVASAALLVRSLDALRSVDAGFEAEDVSLTQINASPGSYPDAAAVRDLYVLLDEAVGAIPGVESVAAAWQTPLQTQMSDWPVMPERTGASEWISADPNLVTPGFFETYGIEVLEGRPFDATDMDLPIGPVILNREGARQLWGDESAVGRRVNLSFGEPVWREVIGVVENVRGRGLAQEPTVQTYMTLGEGPFGRIAQLTLATRGSASGEALRRQLQDVVARVDGQIPLGSTISFESQVARSLERERLVSTLISLFALVGLALGMVGVYGLVAYSVTRRTREIGLRIALGSSRTDVVWLVLGQGARLGALGVALGAATTVLTGRLLEGYLYRISTTDPTTLVAVSLGVLSIATLASFIPARRAAGVTPTIALSGD